MINRHTRWALAAVLLIALPLFFVDTVVWERHVPAAAYAFGHVFAFGGLTLLLMHLPPFRHLRFPLGASLAVGCVLLVGGAIELIQPMFGRSAGLRDMGQNLVGSIAAIALLAPAGRPRAVLAPVAVLLLAVALTGPMVSLIGRLAGW